MKRTFKKENCAPKRKGVKSLKFTCYSEDDLRSMKKSWNDRHLSDKINHNNPFDIHNDLKLKYTKCNKESCWQDDKSVVDRVFAPKMPSSWKKNINEWLSSSDILNVMNQYEKSFPEFEFLGPSPTDYFVKDYGNVCVWPELCKFNLKSTIEKGKTQIGVVFNLDPHYLSGSHWVALYINTLTCSIYYFDSTGDRIHKYINKFRKEVQSQAFSQLNQKYSFDTNYEIEHQYSNTECGMYVLFFIITMLLYDNEALPFQFGKQLKARIGGGKEANLFSTVFKNESLKFPDKLMVQLRKQYFNEV